MSGNLDERGLYRRGGIWWIRYRGLRPDGSRGQIRESSESAEARVAAKLRNDRIREARNDQDGIQKFIGPWQRKVTVGLLLDNLERDYETRQLRSTRTMKTHLEPARGPSVSSASRALRGRRSRCASRSVGRRRRPTCPEVAGEG
jgi:hypothetical protein